MRKDEFPIVDKLVKDRELAIKALEQEQKTDIALERYKDLQDYFSNKDIAKAVLENQTEFKAWLERLRWNTQKVDELARKLEALEQEPRWIPVSERLPKDNGHYLTTTMYGDVCCDYWAKISFDRRGAGMSEWIKCDKCNKTTKADSSGDKRYKIGVDGPDGYSVFHLCEQCLGSFYLDFLEWKWNDDECQYVPQAESEDEEQ